MVATKSEKNKMMVDYDYIDNVQVNFNNEDMINSSPSWLESQKAKDGKLAPSDGTDYLNIVLQLNMQQTLAYNIVKKHFQEKEKLLLSLIIPGQGDSGKSYVIRALQNLLSDTCIVASNFGIEAFDIAGKTFHSLLRLPIDGKNACDLKVKTLAQLQDKLKGIDYFINDEYSVI